MTDEATRPATAGRQALRWCRDNRHFVVAAVILALTAAGWSVLVELAGWATMKQPVPWPAGVEVDDEFRMVSLPDRLGPYEFVSADGELARDPQGRPKKDGRPDGEGIVDDETMGLLKIGTGTDKRNRPKRRSNWFMVRTYRDSRLGPGQSFRYWRAEAYYYTGGVDLVPHVPEICGAAGGATLLSSSVIRVRVPSLPAPWNGEIGLRRAVFEQTALGGGTARFVQYYVLSLNGEPETRRNVVRLRLASPFVKYAYFAKIQLGPLGRVADQRLADEAARDFARNYLPEILKAVAMPRDVEALSAGE